MDESQKLQDEKDQADSLNVSTDDIRYMPGCLAYVLLFVFSVFLYISSLTYLFNSMASRPSYLGDIGSVLKHYIEEKGIASVSRTTWREDLKAYDDQQDKDSKEYLSNYSLEHCSLNEAIFNVDVIPDHMIVLFSLSSGGDPVGGLKQAQNEPILRVLYWDGTSDLYRKRQIPLLKWRPEDKFIPIKTEGDNWFSFLYFVVVSAGIAGVFGYCRKTAYEFGVLVYILMVLSAGVGTLFSWFAENVFYHQAGETCNRWLMIGIVWGGSVALAYIALLGRIFRTYNKRIRMTGYALALGCLSGLITSCLIHGYFMLVHEETRFSFMIFGSAFGALSGFVLGMISMIGIRRYATY